MKLLVGLGNPGEEYSFTRHNVGFMVLDELTRRHSIKLKFNRQFNALRGEGLIGTEHCYLVKPQTFMNLSGYSVRLIFDWLHIGLDEILLVLDDIALPFGAIRIRPKGSDGGHKGLRSVISGLGTDNFARLRVGVRNRLSIKDSALYVLSSFTKSEKKVLPKILSEASDACECWIKEGIDVAMNRYNKLTLDTIRKGERHG